MLKIIEETNDYVICKFIDGKFNNIKQIKDNNIHEAVNLLTGELYKDVKYIINTLSDSKNLNLPTINLKNLNTQVCLTFANIYADTEKNELTADVMIKANTNNISFANMELFISYPTENLDTFIITNNLLAIQKGDVIDSYFYNLNYSDQARDTLKVDISSSCSISSFNKSESHYLIGTEYEQLLTLTFRVNEWGDYGGISLLDFSLKGSASYFNLGSCLDFDDLCVEGENILLNPCEITSVTTDPFAAGILDLISFKGRGFNDSGRIEIPDAETGGASHMSIRSDEDLWVVSWTDNSVNLFISSLAKDGVMSSGDWIIHPEFNEKCQESVDIKYSVYNIFSNDTEKFVALATDKNYINYYIDKSSVTNNQNLINQNISFNDVEEVIMNVFCDWEESSGINFEYLGDNSGVNTEDRKNTIVFTDLGSSPTKARTRRTTLFNECVNGPFYPNIPVIGRNIDSDIEVNTNSRYNWFVNVNSSSIGSNQSDLYSVLVHEVGHMLQLNHANDTNKNNGSSDSRIMFYGISNGQVKREIDQCTIDGSDKIKTDILSSFNTFCDSDFDVPSSSGCTTLAFDLDFNSDLKIFPNVIEKQGLLNVVSPSEMKVIFVYDLYGNMVSKHDINSFNYKLRMPDHSGIYIVVIGDNYKFQSQRIIVE